MTPSERLAALADDWEKQAEAHFRCTAAYLPVLGCVVQLRAAVRALTDADPPGHHTVCIGLRTLERLRDEGAVWFEDARVGLVRADDFPPLPAARAERMAALADAWDGEADAFEQKADYSLSNRNVAAAYRRCAAALRAALAAPASSPPDPGGWPPVYGGWPRHAHRPCSICGRTAIHAAPEDRPDATRKNEP